MAKEPAKKATKKEEEVVDPALAPVDETETTEKPKKSSAKSKKQDPAEKPKLSVGDKVYYAHKESFEGRRLTRVLAVDDDTVTIRGVDGGAKILAIELVEPA